MNGAPPPDLLAYEDTGTGSAVLLIHGLAGTAIAHFGPLIENLSADYRVIAPDLRGCGRSAALAPRGDGDAWFAGDVDDLVALLDALKLDRVHLVGYSDGGEVALLLAARLGARARSAAVWGVSGYVPPPDVLAVFAEPERRIPTWDTMRAELDALHGPGRAAPLLRAWAAAMRTVGQERGQPGQILSDDAARRILCPVLIVAGEHDPFNPLPATQTLARRIASASLVVLPGAGHDLLAECGPDLTRQIRSLLERTAA
jgi:valacyclovir hydrolase